LRFGDLIYGRDVEEVKEKVENHLPRIECPDVVKAGESFSLKVYVPNHPSKVEHSIRFIEVYLYEEDRAFNPIKVARAVFTPEYANPEVTLSLTLKKNSKIFALAYCNKHGLWENSKDVKVE
jgi:superoxide reductase